MEKKKFLTETYFEAPICECGGVYVDRVENVYVMTHPPQAYYKCNFCGKEILLHESDFPTIKHSIDFNKEL